MAVLRVLVHFAAATLVNRSPVGFFRPGEGHSSSVLKPPVLALAIALVTVLPAQPARAQSQEFSEYAVKAHLIHRLLSFVDWPPDARPANGGQPFSICVLGTDPFDADLHLAMDGKTALGRRITIQTGDTLLELERCQVLFISSSEEDRLGEILRSPGNAGVLTISDVGGFIDAGGVIGFVFVEKTLRIQVNLDAARRNGLSLSAQVLGIADRVIHRNPGRME